MFPVILQSCVPPLPSGILVEELNSQMEYQEMFRTMLTVVATLVFASVQAASVSTEDFKVRTTGDLVKLCSASTKDPAYSAARGFCLGYLDAAHDYHAALTAGGEFDPIACPGPDVTRDQVVEALVAWANDNERKLGGEGAIHGVMRAVSAKWPCSRK